ncbi:hypothetical protein [Pseudoduganella violacea]|uniref:Uncharacterized protein n=1 Tax=Pseudoduganella violacea TaxID=1715466 RepID=A0A7W5FWD7_9BURK|nr:hypothetical protein [Pseudoduganella violacea]MBB3121731.1 hypothetical protein [Pseudoduganella violacea]
MHNSLKRWMISYRQSDGQVIRFESVQRKCPSKVDLAKLILLRNEEEYCAAEGWPGARPEDLAEQFFILNQIIELQVVASGNDATLSQPRRPD